MAVHEEVSQFFKDKTDNTFNAEHISSQTASSSKDAMKGKQAEVSASNIDPAKKHNDHNDQTAETP